MESPFWPESFQTTKPIQELIQGQELTGEVRNFVQLSESVSADPTSTDCISYQPLEMFDSFEFSSIMSDDSVNQAHLPINGRSLPDSLQSQRSTNVNKLVKTVKPVKIKRISHIRKRSWTFEVPFLIDDGHTWRKYGQKEITNARHKRNYYRCTHKFDQGCQATKQVQKIEDRPQKYKITYHRHHSCKNFLKSPQIFFDTTDLNDTSVLLNFESNEFILNEKVDVHFPLHTQEESTNRFSSLESMHNQSSVFRNNPLHNLIMSDLSGPVSQISSTLEHGEVISTGLYSPVYEIDHILEDIDSNEISFDFTYSQPIDLYCLN